MSGHQMIFSPCQHQNHLSILHHRCRPSRTRRRRRRTQPFLYCHHHPQTIARMTEAIGHQTVRPQQTARRFLAIPIAIIAWRCPRPYGCRSPAAGLCPRRPARQSRSEDLASSFYLPVPVGRTQRASCCLVHAATAATHHYSSYMLGRPDHGRRRRRLRPELCRLLMAERT
jgi:hypothetical protein